MPTLPHCPACNSEYTYEDGGNYVCPECAHEWPVIATAAVADQAAVVRDAYGNALQDGDTVAVIKESVMRIAKQHEHGEVIDHMLHKMAG